MKCSIVAITALGCTSVSYANIDSRWAVDTAVALFNLAVVLVFLSLVAYYLLPGLDGAGGEERAQREGTVDSF